MMPKHLIELYQKDKPETHLHLDGGTHEVSMEEYACDFDALYNDEYTPLIDNELLDIYPAKDQEDPKN